MGKLHSSAVGSGIHGEQLFNAYRLHVTRKW